MVEFWSNFDQKTVILIKNWKAFFRKARFQNLYGAIRAVSQVSPAREQAGAAVQPCYFHDLRRGGYAGGARFWQWAKKRQILIKFSYFESLLALAITTMARLSW